MLYFAAARDIVSKSRESLVLRDGASVRDLSDEILRLHPELGRVASSVRFSVNLELVDKKTILREEDEVGMLPPVAGG